MSLLKHLVDIFADFDENMQIKLILTKYHIEIFTTENIEPYL